MNTKRAIRKILFVAMWLAIGTGMLTLLIAAIGRQKRDTCKDYSISIKGVKGEDFFLDKADILNMLKTTTKGKMKGQPKTAFDLRKMEQLLEENRWVKDAQLYFDNRDVLHISVTEREPIARVFTVNGKSFYLDDSGLIMQLSDKLNARLPVFTGFPDKKKLSANDSTLLKGIVSTSAFINDDPFWTSQVAQIDISGDCGADCYEFDMIPVVGNHTIKLGNGENIEQKLNRLFIFYKKILSQTGFNKYKTIDVRYSGQVVAGRSENPRVDSVQLRKNVEKLLQQIKEMEELNEAQAKLPTPMPMQPVMPLRDTVVSVGPPQPVKQDAANGSAQQEGRNDGNRTPKAVMPGKRSSNN